MGISRYDRRTTSFSPDTRTHWVRRLRWGLLGCGLGVGLSVVVGFRGVVQAANESELERTERELREQEEKILSRMDAAAQRKADQYKAGQHRPDQHRPDQQQAGQRKAGESQSSNPPAVLPNSVLPNSVLPNLAWHDAEAKSVVGSSANPPSAVKAKGSANSKGKVTAVSGHDSISGHDSGLGLVVRDPVSGDSFVFDDPPAKNPNARVLARISDGEGDRAPAVQAASSSPTASSSRVTSSSSSSSSHGAGGKGSATKAPESFPVPDAATAALNEAEAQAALETLEALEKEEQKLIAENNELKAALAAPRRPKTSGRELTEDVVERDLLRVSQAAALSEKMVAETMVGTPSIAVHVPTPAYRPAPEAPKSPAAEAGGIRQPLASSLQKLEERITAQRQILGDLLLEREQLMSQLDQAHERGSSLNSQLVLREQEIKTLEGQIDRLLNLVDTTVRYPGPTQEIRDMDNDGLVPFPADLPQASIGVDEGQLRLSASAQTKVLASLRRGSRVAIETRMDDWYRVITTTGRRGWVQASQVLFTPRGGYDSSGMLVRVKGYDASLEGEGF